LRGVRLCLANPELFDTQLRAILRAAATRPGAIRIMFPMIATRDEYRAARGRLEAQRAVLAERGIAVGPVPAGIMIEVPAAVASAAELAREVAFFSIGTNDLTQYVMAADRGNAAVAGLADPFQPAVLRAIAATCAAAATTGIPVGMCGEMAGDPRATALLLGLGVHELSMSGGAVAAVKERVRQTTLGEARALAARVLAAGSLDEVRAVLGP
jgi:multiphosphoryl transfer protein